MLERDGYQERRIDFEVREIGNEYLGYSLARKARD
jgi:hypothetical protein